MGLEIQRGRSKWWYCRITVNGKYRCHNLRVPIRGTPPARLSELGDAAFEKSRAIAQVAMDKFLETLNERKSSEEMIQKLHVIRTGKRIATLPLDEMFIRWKQLPRRRALSGRYLKVCASYFDRFRDFAKVKNPLVVNADEVQSELAEAFMKDQAGHGLSPKTYNNILIFLRSLFDALKSKSGMAANPFGSIPTKVEETVFRKPFSAEELARIIEAAKGDSFINPIIITAICTAMRRGDCCQLEWSSVNLNTLFVTVKTSKTGETVQIPIFPPLEALLRSIKRGDSQYVFPEQARMYQTNPDGITLRVRKVFALAGFSDLEDKDSEGTGIRQKRKNGVRVASVRDFHSFRVTWVTIALTSGVPIELVQRVTGHRTAQIVQKHYFQPRADDFRKALGGKLPEVLSGANLAPSMTLDDVRVRLEGMNARNWKKTRDEILEKLK